MPVAGVCRWLWRDLAWAGWVGKGGGRGEGWGGGWDAERRQWRERGGGWERGLGGWEGAHRRAANQTS